MDGGRSALCTKVSLRALWRDITSPSHLHVDAWWPDSEVSRPSCHLTANMNSMGSIYRARNVLGITDNNDVA